MARKTYKRQISAELNRESILLSLKRVMLHEATSELITQPGPQAIGFAAVFKELKFNPTSNLYSLELMVETIEHDR